MQHRAPERDAQTVAFDTLAQSAADNIPEVDFASITVRHLDDNVMQTLAATSPVAQQLDSLQYQLHEGPCYAAVTDERFVLVNDLLNNSDFPRYAKRATEAGVRSQVAMQLVHGREVAGLNLYARRVGVFDSSTIHIADLFAAHAAALLGFATQVDNLGLALHSRQDIGTAVGIVMERYGLDQVRAFDYLARLSNERNVKLRVIAREVIDGTVAPSGDRLPEPGRR